MSFNNLNPAIVKWSWGKKNLTEMDIYPLSVGDQGKVTAIISDVLAEYSNKYQKGEALEASGLVTALYTVLQQHLPQLVAIVCDITPAEASTVADGMTNPQLVLFCQHIWQMNYEEVIKNVKSLMADKIVQGLNQNFPV